MKIGLDLDQTIYGFPEFFKVFIDAMHNAGHELFITSNHIRPRWENEDCPKLVRLGIDTTKLNPELMQTGPEDEGVKHKVKMSQYVDYMFDDMQNFNSLTNTVIFQCPFQKAIDKG